MFWGETNEETNNLKTRQCVARYVETYVWCSGKQSKAKVGYRATKAPQCQEITWCLLYWTWGWRIQNTSWKTLVESLKFRCQQQCLAKHQQLAAETPAAILGNTKPNMPVLSIPTNLWGINSLSHESFVHKFIPMPQALKKNRCKGSSGKWENLRKYGSWQKSETKEVIEEARNNCRKVHFTSLMDLCHFKNSELEPKFQKVPRQSRTPRWHCERWFRIRRSIYWTRIISIADDSSESHGYHLQTAGLRRTSSWRSTCL